MVASIGVVAVLVVEADPVVRRGLCSFAREGADVVATVADASSACTWLDADVDVVIAGITPEQLETLALGPNGRDRDDRCDLVLVATRLNDALVQAVFQAGARGLLRRDSVESELLDAIEAVTRGDTWVDAEVRAMLIELSLKGRPQGTDAQGLTVQERRVVRLLPRQLTNQQIADELGISPDTVKTHLRHSMKKLGAHDRIEAARIVERYNIT